MEDFECGDSPYVLNYAEIVKSKDMMAITRMLASDLMHNPYLVVGDWIKSISDAELEAIVKEMDRPDDRQYENLLLISAMLSSGEGCAPCASEDDFTMRMNQLVSFLVCESLARKGLVKVYHENMSFHEDMQEKIIVERLDE